MAFTIGSGTFTNGSATVTGVTLTSGTLAYFASGTRMVVGVNPVIQEVEAIAAPTVSTITLRSAWTGTGGTYSFLANQTSEGLRDAVQAIRTNNASLQSFIDSIDTAATANSVAQRTSDGSLNVTDLNASRNAFIGTTDSNSARLTATSGSGSCIYGNSVSVFSRESGTATQSIIGMNQTGVDAPFIDFRKDGVTVGNIGTSSGDIYFGSGSSGTERMRIDSSGNVGIGTSGPSARLEVNTPDFQQMILRRGITGDGAGILSFVQGNGTAAGHVGGLTGGGLQFRTGDSTGTERMRIDLSGNVSTFGSVDALQISHSGAAGTTQNLILGKHSATGTGTGTTSFVVRTNGNVLNTNNSYGALSDAKIKENIEPASPKLDKLMQVDIVNYNLIGEELKQIGVVAQQLEEVFPSMVDESDDYEEVETTTVDEDGNETTEKTQVATGAKTKSVKYSVFVPILIKAMQEQQEIIKALEARIEALEG